MKSNENSSSPSPDRGFPAPVPGSVAIAAAESADPGGSADAAAGPVPVAPATGFPTVRDGKVERAGYGGPASKAGSGSGDSEESLSGASALEIYLSEVSRVPLLTHEEEVRLASRVLAGRLEPVKLLSTIPYTAQRLLEERDRFVEGGLQKRDYHALVSPSGYRSGKNKQEKQTFEQMARRFLQLSDRVDKLHRRRARLSVKQGSRAHQSADRIRREIRRIFEEMELSQAFYTSIQAELQSIADGTSGRRGGARKAAGSPERRVGMQLRDLHKVLLTLKTVEMEADDARRRMMEANLRLVISVARKMAGSGPHLMDLIQEGNIGLLRAVNKFDHRLGFRFSTYATWWIRQAVNRSLVDCQRTIKLPIHLHESMNKVVQAVRRFKHEEGRDPLPEEVAGRLQLSAVKVRLILENTRNTVSLDSTIGDEEKTLKEFLGDGREHQNPEGRLSTAQLSRETERALATLSPEEATILRMRFGMGPDGEEHTLDQVGRSFNITRERTRQIEARALRKLRHPSRCGELRQFLMG